jgi:hypothetical protein
MTNKFVSFLEDIGKDFEKGLEKLEPITQDAMAALPELMMVSPAAGAVAQTTLSVISTVEQNFAAMGQQTGTGAQKMATALSILTPVVTQALVAAHQPSDSAAVQKYVQAAVTYLNSLPAPAATTASPTPATS